jgi:hypothetical protein
MEEPQGLKSDPGATTCNGERIHSNRHERKTTDRFRAFKGSGAGKSALPDLSLRENARSGV